MLARRRMSPTTGGKRTQDSGEWAAGRSLPFPLRAEGDERGSLPLLLYFKFWLSATKTEWPRSDKQGVARHSCRVFSETTVSVRRGAAEVLRGPILSTVYPWPMYHAPHFKKAMEEERLTYFHLRRIQWNLEGKVPLR